MRHLVPTPGLDLPLDPSIVAPKLTSPYGMRFLEGKWKMHSGIDLWVPSGTPVYAPADGEVKASGPSGGSGCRIIIYHGSGPGSVRTSYSHLTNLIAQTGQTVRRGEMIGQTGGAKGDPCAGHSTGPHLHFTVGLWDSSQSNNYAKADPLHHIRLASPLKVSSNAQQKYGLPAFIEPGLYAPAQSSGAVALVVGALFLGGLSYGAYLATRGR